MKEKSILHRIIYYMNPKRIDPSMRKLWIFFILFNILLFFIPRNISRASIWILVPMIGLFIYALVTKDVFQSSLMGTLSLYILWYKWNAITAFFNDCKIVLADSENIEMYMSFFLCGGLVIAMKRSDATKAFTEYITERFGENEKLLLTASGIYAGIMSIDDYVSAFTSGIAFSPLIDKIKKPRLALAYVIRTFSICVSAMLPVGAWGYFIIFQIANAKNIHGKVAAMQIFLKSVPFMFYAIIACIVAFLFAAGILPKFGHMKKAYMMSEQGKQLGELTDGSEEEENDFDEDDERKQNISVLNLVIPMAAVVIALIATGRDCFLAFGIALIITGILYILQGIMTISEYLQCVIDGFIDMVDMVVILMLGYAMQEVMDTMGMEGLVQKICQMIPVVSLIPFVIFMIFSFTEFLYSLNYTLYQIAIPVMIVVLPKLGANLPLCIGAIISAGLFGANACVVSDLGIISARASRVTVYDQYESSLPYVLISGVVAAIMYLIAGFIF